MHSYDWQSYVMDGITKTNSSNLQQITSNYNVQLRYDQFSNNDHQINAMNFVFIETFRFQWEVFKIPKPHNEKNKKKQNEKDEEKNINIKSKVAANNWRNSSKSTKETLIGLYKLMEWARNNYEKIKVFSYCFAFL